MVHLNFQQHFTLTKHNKELLLSSGFILWTFFLIHANNTISRMQSHCDFLCYYGVEEIASFNGYNVNKDYSYNDKKELRVYGIYKWIIH